MINILIADDHPIVRHGLRRIIEKYDDMKVCCEAGSGEEIFEEVFRKGCNCSVLLLDISMPGIPGLDVIKQIKSQKPEIQILVLSVHPAELYAVRSVKAGASGYLVKTSAPDELANAIRKVAGGEKYLGEALAMQLLAELGKDEEKPLHCKLSDREYEVMCLLGKGETTGSIAKKLILSPKTVSTYKSRIMNKMNFNNDAQLLKYVIEKELVI